MIRKLKSGEYRLYSRKTDPKTGKRRNLGTFDSREAAEKHVCAPQEQGDGTGKAEQGQSKVHLVSRSPSAALELRFEPAPTLFFVIKLS